MRERERGSAVRREGARPLGGSAWDRMRHGFTAALLAGLASLLLIGGLWVVSREAPSAGRDPNMTPLVLVPTRTPTPAATPAVPPPA
jgi:hypothetical protein